MQSKAKVFLLILYPFQPGDSLSLSVHQPGFFCYPNFASMLDTLQNIAPVILNQNRI